MGQIEKMSGQDRFVILDSHETLTRYGSRDLLRDQAGLMDMLGDIGTAVESDTLWDNLLQQRHGSRQMQSSLALLRRHTSALERELLRKTRAYELRLAEQDARIAALTAEQARLERLAGHDELTGLANRRTFTDRLTQAIKRATRTGSSLAVLFLDLDDFKFLNDCYGHDTGDQILRQVAERLDQCTRGGDTVCRWGGDEFALVTENAGETEANMLAERIMATLDQPIVIGDTSISVSASIGFCLFPEDGVDAAALMRNSDAAMYQAKRSGKSDHPTATGNTMLTTTPATSVPQSLGCNSAATLLTIEEAAAMLGLSRPHVFKLIDERRFSHVVWQDRNLPLIPLSEISRFTQETVI